MLLIVVSDKTTICSHVSPLLNHVRYSIIDVRFFLVHPSSSETTTSIISSSSSFTFHQTPLTLFEGISWFTHCVFAQCLRVLFPVPFCRIVDSSGETTVVNRKLEFEELPPERKRNSFKREQQRKLNREIESWSCSYFCILYTVTEQIGTCR